MHAPILCWNLTILVIRWVGKSLACAVRHLQWTIFPVTSYASRLHPTTLHVEFHITISSSCPQCSLSERHCVSSGAQPHSPPVLKTKGSLTPAHHRSYLLSPTASAATDSCASVLLIATHYYRIMPSSNAMSPSPTTPYSRTPAQVVRSKSDVSLMRDKNGCITCRVRQKKCSGVESGQGSCGDCRRLNVQCLGVQHNRPDWLRNPEALKETKHRIKHFLTEYPVPRGRGPAPERPHLNFHDLIDKYSPRVPSLDECKHLTIKSERLYRMEPESPPPPHSAYLSVQPARHTPSTPSPSSSYAAMPRTPTSAEDSLFTPDIPTCNYPGGMFNQEVFMPQVVGAAYPEAYMQYDAYNSNMVSTPVSPVSPYRHDYSQTVIITTPVAPFHHDPYLTDHLPSPSARRQ